MTVTDQIFESFKKLVLKEAFASADPKTITDDMIKNTIAKGLMFCPSKDKFICFGCAAFIPFKKDQVTAEGCCPFCNTKLQ